MAAKQAKTDPILKQRVLSFAKQVGDEKAAEKFGVARSTVRTWRFQANRSASATVRPPGTEAVAAAVASKGASRARAKVDRSGDELSIDELRRSARRAHKTFDKAVVRLNEVLETSKNPHAIAIAAGVMQTKASEMAGLIMALEERDVRLSAAQGELVVAVLRAVLEACGVPITEAVKRALGEALRGATDDGEDVIVVSPDVAAAAARDVLDAVGRLQLPESVGSDPVEEIDGQLSVDDVIEATGPEEITDAVVEPDPLPPGWLELNHGDPAAARKAYESFRNEERDREQRKRDRPDAWRVDPGGSRGSKYHELYREPTGGPGGGV